MLLLVSLGTYMQLSSAGFKQTNKKQLPPKKLNSTAKTPQTS